MRRQNRLKTIFRFTLRSILILLLLFPVVTLLLVLEQEPRVIHVQPVNTNDAVKTRDFVKRVVQGVLEKSARPLTLSATEAEINGLFAVGHRSIPEISGVAMIFPERFEIEATLKIPDNPIGNILGNYLNFRLNLLPTTSGFLIERASVGRITFSDQIVRFFAVLALDLAFGRNEGSALLLTINSVEMTEGRIDVHLRPIPNIRQLVQRMKIRFKWIRDESTLMGDPESVRIYYAKLIEVAEKTSPEESGSLAYFIGKLFSVAQHRGGDPVIENRAAILALGIYFGSWRVEQIVGPVQTERMRRHKKQTDHVTLAGRQDLRLHFIISAALQIASESGITHAIGEFKELLDAGKGGSGFSFVDLAADRAGVRFAEVATHPSTAQKIQARLAGNASEALFFPDIIKLPEGLSEKTFEHYFGNLESERYRTLVEKVDYCLEQLPAYSEGEEQIDPSGCNIAQVVPAALL